METNDKRDKERKKEDQTIEEDVLDLTKLRGQQR